MTTGLQVKSRVANVEDEVVETPKTTGQMVSYDLVMAGRDTVHVSAAKGTTLGDVVRQNEITRLEVRVSGRVESRSYEIQEGDVVVAIPDAVAGGRV